MRLSGTILVCTLPGRIAEFVGTATGDGATISAVSLEGKRLSLRHDFRLIAGRSFADSLLADFGTCRDRPLLDESIRKTVFALVIGKTFGLPLWERIEDARALIEAVRVPVGTATYLRYHSGHLTVVGFVSLVPDGNGRYVVRVFFSKSAKHVMWADPVGIDLGVPEIMHMALDRAMVGGWYESVHVFFLGFRSGPVFGIR